MKGDLHCSKGEFARLLLAGPGELRLEAREEGIGNFCGRKLHGRKGVRLLTHLFSHLTSTSFRQEKFIFQDSLGKNLGFLSISIFLELANTKKSPGKTCIIPFLCKFIHNLCPPSAARECVSSNGKALHLCYVL